MNFRTLKADEIDVKVGNVTKTGYTLLLYKNARVDMAILDETVGAENWQRDHKEVKGNLYCGIGIYTLVENGIGNITEHWVWKWDCGVESAFGDKEKGEASDSFKRAGFNWGIGRELYTSPVIKIDCETTEEKDKNGKVVYKLPSTEKYRSFRVKEIEYDTDREISKLVIIDSKGIQVFPKTFVEQKPKLEPVEMPKVVNTSSFDDTELKCVNCLKEVKQNVADYSISKYGKVLCYDCQKKEGK